jgi:hypothetical protein
MSGFLRFFFALGVSVLAMAVVSGLLTLAYRSFVRLLHYWRTQQLLAAMRRAGRFLPRAEFEEHLAVSEGTVLIEYPTVGWRGLWVWWTSDDVVALARAAGFHPEHATNQGLATGEMEAWCRDRYLDRERGRALLVPIYAVGGGFQTYGGTLRERAPELSVVKVRSAALA